MFVQVIEGRTSNPDGLRAQFDKWVAEIQPGAKGYVGTTGGVAADGRVVVFARFASEDAARANSERAEQGAWWADTEKLLDDVQFSESSDVSQFLGGGSDEAGCCSGHRRSTSPGATCRPNPYSSRSSIRPFAIWRVTRNPSPG